MIFTSSAPCAPPILQLGAAYLSVIEERRRSPRAGPPRCRAWQGMRGGDRPHQLARPYPCFSRLAMDGLRVVPRHVVESVTAEAFDRSPSDRPFRVRRWDDAHLVLARNPTTGETRPGWTKWTSCSATRAAARHRSPAGGRGGCVGGAGRGPGAPAGAETSAPLQEPVRGFPGSAHATPPLDDVRIRQAVASAINRDALVAERPAPARKAVGSCPRPPRVLSGPKASPTTRSARAPFGPGGKDGRARAPPIALYTRGRAPPPRACWS